MSQRIYDRVQGIARGQIIMSGKIVLGTSGAISSSTSKKYSGFSVVKTGSKTGRYTITLDKAYAALENVDVSIEGATDAAYTSTKGLWLGLLRNNAVATAGTFDFQLQRSDTAADAEAIDSATLHVTIIVRDAKLT